MYEGTLQAFALIKQQLQLEYVDLLLTHWPDAGSVNATAKRYRLVGLSLPLSPSPSPSLSLSQVSSHSTELSGVWCS